ncbi:MAG: hypothetical protein HY718_05845, partial [Planctomycetes bacterium]|nr:hypothetical protein [Planctomycetota bacterium]
ILESAAGVATFTATLTAAVSPIVAPVTVNLGVSGTADLDSDYSLSALQVVFPAGTATGATRTVTLTAVNDNETEGPETATVTIASVTNATIGAPSSQSVTITDDGSQPSVALTPAPASPILESAAGVATFTATLTAAVSPIVAPVTVNLGVSGTADLNSDYTLSALQVVFPAGTATAATQTVTLTAVDDRATEGDETATVTIASVTNATIGAPSSQSVTITDDSLDPTVSLSFVGGVSTLAENGGTVTVRATLSAATTRDVTVNLVFSGTADQGAGADYTVSSSQITILAGATTGDVTITGVNDNCAEVDETIQVGIGSATNATPAGGLVTATIVDDDIPPSVLLDLNGGPATIFENNGGVGNPTQATVRAFITVPVCMDVVVELAFGGTAEIGTDYTLAVFDNRIFIPAGATEGTLDMPAIDDLAVDGAVCETAVISIASVVNGTGVGNSTTFNIVDVQSLPAVDLLVNAAAVPVNVNEVAPGNTAAITAVIAAPVCFDITVTLAFAGTATGPGSAPGDDYDLDTTTLVITAGNTTSNTATLTAVDDGALNDGGETVDITINTVTNGTVGAAAPQITIND